MQEFVIKKLAEVQAFVDLGHTLVSRADKTFTEKAPKVSKALSAQVTDLQTLIKTKEGEQTFRNKRSKTVTKLTRMMELYVGDEWDNSVEILEWLSFYAGAAAAHSALVCGALKGSTKLKLKTLSDNYLELLDDVIEALRKTGDSHVS